MTHIDTLEVYREYIAAGYTENQAVTAVKVLNASFNGVATKEDLNLLEEKLETRLGARIDAVEARLEAKMDSKFGAIKALGCGIFVVVCVPVLQGFITWQSLLKHFGK